MDLIRKSLRALETAASCLDFQEISDPSNTTNYIKFTSDGDQDLPGIGCWSYVGEQGGEQVTVSFNIMNITQKIFLQNIFIR